MRLEMKEGRVKSGVTRTSGRAGRGGEGHVLTKDAEDGREEQAQKEGGVAGHLGRGRHLTVVLTRLVLALWFVREWRGRCEKEEEEAYLKCVSCATHGCDLCLLKKPCLVAVNACSPTRLARREGGDEGMKSEHAVVVWC